ncbi:histidinol dehydrogenase [Pelagicoccus mobilis]|uniref:Histidinol dehydrogenase n=1 Tax=Pelagicoccus mobilis TaxID=415221 RepID=A0A934RYK9_9BACT|nr:histidinol dehydrogenase [Pelagicoccus mobilis]MBK1877875.1 histidinol dehydrogenase [Pelagicoccus mobilis]
MADLAYSSRTFWDKLSAFCKSAEVPQSIVDAASSVLGEVREHGDAGVAKALKRIDKVSLSPDAFSISRDEMKAAVRRLPKGDVQAIKDSVASVTEFHKHALPKSWTAKNAHGATIGERFYPLERVGLYIPRNLVSTVVMTAALAKLAGVKEIVAFTPCGPDGKVNDGCLAAMYLSGVTEAYRFGGIMAIGAAAYGTETIKPVLKVYGPGNAFVVEAKRQVFGTIGVDLLPGPSELLVIADDHADADFVASDLLAQAEHGSGREKIFLVSLSKEKTKAIRAAIREQMKSLPRKDAIKAVLKDGFFSVVVKDYDEAAAVANFVAPEHMELEVDPKQFNKLIKSITTAGAIMQGAWSATALGDFVAGPSHELPTGRSGRHFSGLQISDFMRRSSLVRYSKSALKKAAGTVEAFARMEGLEAHGRSVSSRLEKEG